MAIIGALVTQGVYRLVARKSPLRSTQRAIAAGLAGYAGINAAALATGIELGLQPHFFHEANGTPLYAPYPLAIAVPVMMLGHLTVFGMAETIVAIGLVSYLQKADPQILRFNAPGTSDETVTAPLNLRSLWAGLALLMVFTPLGLCAAGTAWGEWRADEFSDPQARAAMVAASMGHAPPSQVPTGLHKLSQIWSAPLPDYAPAFLKNEALGYILSAMVGAGLVIGICLLLGAIMRRLRPTSLAQDTPD